MIPLALLLAAAPAVQDQPAGAPAPKKVCRPVQVTGSNLPRRECRTAEEWKAIQRATLDHDDRMRVEQLQLGSMRPGGN